jgi:hypothetical protein
MLSGEPALDSCGQTSYKCPGKCKTDVGTVTHARVLRPSACTHAEARMCACFISGDPLATHMALVPISDGASSVKSSTYR